MADSSLALFLLGALLSLCSAQYGPDPPNVPKDFLCAWRELVFNYSAVLRPESTDLIFDALQLRWYTSVK